MLACDLSKYEYQAVDFGHSDIMYELYLRNATKMIQIPHKFVNEYNFGRNENWGMLKILIIINKLYLKF